MSDIIELKESFKDDSKVTKLKIVNDLVFIDTSKKNYVINPNEIVSIDLLNARCPKPTFRMIPILVEVLTAILIVLIVVFNKLEMKVLTYVFIGLAVVSLFAAALVGKAIYSKSNEAIQISILKKDKKRVTVLGIDTNTQDYNRALRYVKDIKKLNKEIKLDMRQKK